MQERIEVVYENGVFRPLEPVPSHLHERQRLTVTVEGPTAAEDWLADADPTVSLEAVREALGKATTTLSQLVQAEREER